MKYKSNKISESTTRLQDFLRLIEAYLKIMFAKQINVNRSIYVSKCLMRRSGMDLYVI